MMNLLIGVLVLAALYVAWRQYNKWYWRPLKQDPRAPKTLYKRDLKFVPGAGLFYARTLEEGFERKSGISYPGDTVFYRAYYTTSSSDIFELVTETHPQWEYTPDKEWLKSVPIFKKDEKERKQEARKRQGL